DPNNPLSIIAGGDLASAVFVTRLSPSGAQMEYSTYLSGNGNDAGLGIALDSTGGAVVAGRTDSTNLTALVPLQAANQGRTDAFVSQLNSAGSKLSFSTYFGGAAADQARAVAIDAAGSIYLAGDTTSTDFPHVAAFQQN